MRANLRVGAAGSNVEAVAVCKGESDLLGFGQVVRLQGVPPHFGREPGDPGLDRMGQGGQLWVLDAEQAGIEVVEPEGALRLQPAQAVTKPSGDQGVCLVRTQSRAGAHGAECLLGYDEQGAGAECSLPGTPRPQGVDNLILQQPEVEIFRNTPPEVVGGALELQVRVHLRRVQHGVMWTGRVDY